VQPTIYGNNGASDLINIGDNATVGNLRLRGDFYDGIAGESGRYIRNFTIMDNDIDGANSDGVEIDVLNPSSSGVVMGNTVTSSGEDGIDVDVIINDGASHEFDLLVQDNFVRYSNLSNQYGQGIELGLYVYNYSTLVSDITVDGNYVADTYAGNQEERGEYYNNTFYFTEDNDAILVRGLIRQGSTLESTIEITDNTVLRSVYGDGIDLTLFARYNSTLDLDNTITVSGNTALYNNDDGIDFDIDAFYYSSMDVVATLANNDSRYNGYVGTYYASGDGFDLDFDLRRYSDGYLTLTLQDNTANFNANDGIDIDIDARYDSSFDVSNTVTITGNTAEQNGAIFQVYIGYPVYNYVTGALGDGINVDFDAIDDSDIDLVLSITDNLAKGNFADGIDLDFDADYFSTQTGTVDISYNTAIDNGRNYNQFGSGSGIEVTVDITDYSTGYFDNTFTFAGNYVQGNYGSGFYVSQEARNNSALYSSLAFLDNEVFLNGFGYSFYAQTNPGTESGGIRLRNEVSGNSTFELTSLFERNEVRQNDDDGVRIEQYVGYRGHLDHTLTMRDNTVSDNDDEGVHVETNLGYSGAPYAATYASFKTDITLERNEFVRNDNNKGFYLEVDAFESLYVDIDLHMVDNDMLANDRGNFEIYVDSFGDTDLSVDLTGHGNRFSYSHEADGAYFNIFANDRTLDGTYADIDLYVHLYGNEFSNNEESGFEVRIDVDRADLELDWLFHDNTIGSNQDKGLNLRVDVTGYDSGYVGYAFADIDMYFADNNFSNNDEENFYLDIDLIGNVNGTGPRATVDVDIRRNAASQSGDDEGFVVDLNVQRQSNANLTLDVVDNTAVFNDNGGLELDVRAYNDSTVYADVYVLDNNFNYGREGFQAIDLNFRVGGTSYAPDYSVLDLDFLVDNNLANGHDGSTAAIEIDFFATSYGTFRGRGTVSNNQANGGADIGGIDIGAIADYRSDLDLYLDITGNSASRTDDEGLRVGLRASRYADLFADLEISNNEFTQNADEGIELDLYVGRDGYADAASMTVQADIWSNDAHSNDEQGLLVGYQGLYGGRGTVNGTSTLTLDLYVSDNDFSYSSDDEGVFIGLIAVDDGSIDADIYIVDNTVNRNAQEGIELVAIARDTAEVYTYVLFDNNTIVNNGQTAEHDGIDLFNYDNGNLADMYARFVDNYIVGNRGDGIDLRNRGADADQYAFFGPVGGNTVTGNGLAPEYDIYIYNYAGDQTVNLYTLVNTIGDYGSTNAGGGTQTITP